MEEKINEALKEIASHSFTGGDGLDYVEMEVVANVLLKLEEEINNDK